MVRRITTAILGIALLVPFVIFSADWPLVLMTEIMSLVAVYEILQCTKQLSKLQIAVPSFAVAICSQVLPRMVSPDIYLSVMILVYMAYVITMMTFAVFSKGNVLLSDISQTALMTVYVTFGFACLILLRDFHPDYGIVYFLLAFLIPWVCDAAAYFVGVFFGKHKMIPDVSPKKTVEGAVGGIVGVLAVTAVFALIMHFGFGKVPNYIYLFFLAFVGGIVSQWGDLIASLLKREYSVKDYGKLFPGHGGVMDRFDSLFSVSVFMYIVCRIFERFPLFVNW